MNKLLFTFILFAGLLGFTKAQVPVSEEARFECTTITVGKKASDDGSVRTSHTDDSHRTRSNIYVTPAKEHKAGTTVTMYKRTPCDTTKMRSYLNTPIGEISQVSSTYGYLNSAYPCLNEKQLAIGESTFGGRAELESDNGLIDCQRLCQLMLERCSTARDAIRTAGELLKEYGWIDAGECLTIADKKEVWHLEIVGEGKGKRGAVWAAQRVPDEHIAVNANASTIRWIDTLDKDHFMYSDNVFSVAIENGWWNPEPGRPFEFCYAYAPATRVHMACRRREWRVYDLLAPSLKLDPNSENYPFSVKPDKLVSLEDMVRVFQDYYEGTPYDMRKTLTVADDSGKVAISPFANPFMHPDEMKMHRINGGWNQFGERAIAVRFTMYATILQCRDWLPDEIGGVCWYALDNPASSIYVPIYSGVTDLPSQYKTDGRVTGFSKDAAWWAFNRVGILASRRWGNSRTDVEAVWKPFQKEMFDKQKEIEAEALKLYNPKNPKKTKEFLTKYTDDRANEALKKAWNLGDDLWTKYEGMW
ncbi:C69 family dipeptidase [Bacteroidales bacterium OttesenSCG-928-C19]|nr:C69 family dipeptidase [Bacteroidales bacterium OttesenSCG-928-C19]